MNPSWDDVAVGDKVVVELSGQVTHRSSDKTVKIDVDPLDYDSFYFNHDSLTLKSIEKPVVTFKPGDVVRNKITGGVITIGDGRCFVHSESRWDEHGGVSHTSDYYELVDA